jgi:peptidoglycan/xylan/chitin deacetylase (PgdA/CDA1 family)
VIRPLPALALAALVASAPAAAQPAVRAPSPAGAVGPLPGAAPALAPNELGRVMILEYHRIDVPEERWTRTPENFRRDLQALHSRGYRLMSLNDLLDGRITVPAGTSPVILTFDDSSPGQFRYLERNGQLEIDPRSGVGILEQFVREHPDFGRAATFFVLPGASRPNRLFDQPEHEGRKLRWLVSQGYEIGNHTLWHANLGKYDEATVRAQVAEAQVWIQRHVPGYRTRTLALPHGVYPRNVDWVRHGTAKGTTYRIDGILMVAGGAAPSPFARSFDPVRLPRIQAVERDLARWIGHFDRHPEDRFVSDGDPGTVAVPAALRDRLRDPLRRDLRVVVEPSGASTEPARTSARPGGPSPAAGSVRPTGGSTR